MTADGGAEAFDKLKEILLGDATRRLDDVAGRLEQIHDRVGDRKRLENATAEILIEALQQTEVKRHRELAATLAPLVVSAIRTEIKNSKEMMIEALYPITGRLVTAAVANAFRELVEDLNRRIDALVSTHRWRLRMRAVVSGRSMAEVALAEADAGRLRRALLLERGSGRVLAIWPTEGQNEGDADLASGMIAAITEFAANVYADRGGELRMLDLGANHVFLRASPRVIIAAEFGGDLSSHRESRLDEAFLSIVERHDRDDDACTPDVIGGLLNDALSEKPAKPRSKKPIVVVAAIALALIAWAASGPVTRSWRESRIHAAFQSALGTHPELVEFPLRLDIEHDAGRVVLRGLSPDERGPQTIAEALAPAAAPYRVERDVKVIVLAPQAEHLQTDGARAGALLQETEAQIETMRAQLNEARAALDALRAKDDAPLTKLRRFIDSFAVFFTDQDNLVDPAATAAGLDELAGLLKASNASLRVVGYADEIGAPAVNRAASRKRADKIVGMLIERGVPRERLVLTPRSTLNPIADTGLEAARSRRVAFEIPFAREFDLR